MLAWERAFLLSACVTFLFEGNKPSNNFLLFFKPEAMVVNTVAMRLGWKEMADL